MKTRSIMVQTLSVPCNCHCRYCLLSWSNYPVGADYEKSKEYAKKFHKYMNEYHPEIQFNFAFGYCMDHPQLLKEIDFLNSIGSVQGQFLQLDGMKFRNAAQIGELMSGLAKHGIKHVNFTFYGLRDYHDRFAGRKGDFGYLLDLAGSAARYKINTSAGIPLTSENTPQVEELIVLLEAQQIQKITLFVPHEEGRGELLSGIRFSQSDFDLLGPKGKGKLNLRTFRTEGQWVNAKNLPVEENRSLLISLTPDNIRKFEEMEFEEAIRYVERLDDAYYAALPTFGELCEMYGNPNGTSFYGKRDLFRHYQKRYIEENHLSLYDVTDERYCGSRRY